MVVCTTAMMGSFGSVVEEIREAARKASVDGFIMTLSEGYETEVGELVDTLSGGERRQNRCDCLSQRVHHAGANAVSKNGNRNVSGSHFAGMYRYHSFANVFRRAVTLRRGRFA